MRFLRKPVVFVIIFCMLFCIISNNFDNAFAATAGDIVTLTASDITAISLKDENGNEFSSANPIHDGDNVKIGLNFKISNENAGAGVIQIDLNTYDNIKNFTSGLCIAGVNSEVGTFTVVDGVVKIVYDWAALEALFPGQSEYIAAIKIDAVADIDGSDVDSSNNVVIKIADTNLTVPFALPDSSLSIGKSVVEQSTDTYIVNDNGDIYQQFAITAASDGDNTDINIEDTLSSSSLSFATDAPYNATITLGGATTSITPTISGSPEKATFSIPSISDGQEAVIKYWVKIDPSAYSNVWGQSNGLVARFTNNNGDEDESSLTTPVNFKLSNIGAYKDGTVSSTGNANEKKIAWTITVTGGDCNEGYTIKDTETKTSSAAAGSVKTLPTVVKATLKNEDGTVVTEGTFPYSQLTAGTTLPLTVTPTGGYSATSICPAKGQKLELTYDTVYDTTDVQVTDGYYVSNKIDATKTNWPTATYTSNKGVVEQQNITITKTADSYNLSTNEVTWTVTVTVPSSFTNLTLHDLIGLGQTLGDVPAGFTFTEDAGFVPDATNGLKYDVVLSGAVPNASGYCTYTITYKTVDDLSEMKLNNTVSLSYEYAGTPDETTPVTAYYSKNPVKKKEGWQADSKTGRINWFVTVNLSTVDCTTNTLVLNDTLPENCVLVEDSFKIDGTGTAVVPDISGTAPDMEIDITDIVVAFKAANPSATEMKLAYQTVFEDLEEAYNAGAKAYVNKVSATYGGNTSEEESATVWATFNKGNIIEKSLTYSAASPMYMSYTVDINPNALKLLKDGATKLYVDDELGSALTYDKTNLVIKRVSDGVDITSSCGVEYAGDLQSMSIEIPDETALKITYVCLVNLPAGTDTRTSTELTDSVSNSVSLRGVGTWTLDDKVSYQGIISSASSTIHPTSAILTLTKVDEDDDTILLKNAKFKVYIVKIDNGEFVPADPAEIVGYTGPVEKLTGEDGVAKFSGLLYDQYYCFEEITPPAGYVLNADTKGYFLFDGDDPRTDFASVPAGIEVRRIFNYMATGSAVITNAAGGGSPIEDISISKVCPDGASVKPLEGAVLELYKGKTTSGKPAGVPIATWTSEDTEFDVSGGDLEYDTYYTIYEKSAPTGYDTAANITFKINADGDIEDISATAYETSSAAERLIVMLDEADDASGNDPSGNDPGNKKKPKDDDDDGDDGGDDDGGGDDGGKKDDGGGKKTNAPKTGDMNCPENWLLVILLGMIAVAGGTIFDRRKKKENQ